jgi:hypothetical protein
MLSILNVPPVLSLPPVFSSQVYVLATVAPASLSAPASLNLDEDSHNTPPLQAAMPLQPQPKPVVKSILLWSTGAGRALESNSPLIAVLAAQNPRSPQAAALSSANNTQSGGAEAQVSEDQSSAQSSEDKSAEDKSAEDSSSEDRSTEDRSTENQAQANIPSDPSETAKNCLAAEEMLPHTTFPTLYEVQVKGQPIAYLPTQAAANTLTQQITQILEQPQFDPNSLQPAIINGIPVGKTADTILFEITPDLAAAYDHNPTVLAIAWVNELRTAMGAAPIALTDAQTQLYRLTPTRKQLRGNASWYHPAFEGSPTATGELFSPTDLTAAHPTLPFGTYLKVINPETADSVIVRINDRGPYLIDRSLDLSGEAARCLNSKISGVIPFRAVIMEPLAEH